MTGPAIPFASRRKPGPTNSPLVPPISGSRLSPLAQARLALTASGEALLRREPGRRIGLVVLIVGPLLAGCATTDSTSEQERRGGFYGGVSGGMGSHP